MSWSLSPASGKKLWVSLILEGGSSSSLLLPGWVMSFTRCFRLLLFSEQFAPLCDKRVKIRLSYVVIPSVLLSIVCTLPSSHNAPALSRATIVVADCLIVQHGPLEHFCYQFSSKILPDGRNCVEPLHFFTLYMAKMLQ